MYPTTHAAGSHIDKDCIHKEASENLDVGQLLKLDWLSACEAKYTAAEMPGREVLETALGWTPTPRPIPNLGYACLNMDLREQKPPIFTNRSSVPPPPPPPPLQLSPLGSHPSSQAGTCIVLILCC